MTQPSSNPILSARYLAIVEPELPANHVPSFATYDAETGMAACLRCKRYVTSWQWASETCKGAKNEGA